MLNAHPLHNRVIMVSSPCAILWGVFQVGKWCLRSEHAVCGSNFLLRSRKFELATQKGLIFALFLPENFKTYFLHCFCQKISKYPIFTFFCQTIGKYPFFCLTFARIFKYPIFILFLPKNCKISNLCVIFASKLGNVNFSQYFGLKIEKLHFFEIFLSIWHKLIKKHPQPRVAFER